MSRDTFRQIFGSDPLFTAESCGRTELGGNHTDHQRGIVLASPVSLKMSAWARPNESGKVRIVSEGYGEIAVDLEHTQPKQEERGTSAALIRGIAAGFVPCGKGFDAYIVSEIPIGCGLASSAAFEILLGRLFSMAWGEDRSRLELAKLGQRAENVYFGKPCGLMDQMACASDGIVRIDFADPDVPKTEELNVRFSEFGYGVCIVRCGSDHAHMTAEYASITEDLAAVCACFGKKVLREVPVALFYEQVKDLRQQCGDSAVLRAMHVYGENRRVLSMADALREKRIDDYLQLVRESGRSSWELLQNVIPRGAAKRQDMAFALAMAEKVLKGEGAVRVHGGGFAGTIQAYVPLDRMVAFVTAMNAVLGENSCILPF